MKKINFLAPMALAALLLTSCGGPKHTPESVFLDVFSAATGKDASTFVEGTHYGVQDGMYYSTLTFGTFGEEYLELAVNQIVGVLPEYLVEVEGTALDEWIDGTAGAFALYETDDSTVLLELGSYVDEGTLKCQIATYAAPTEAE